MKTNMKKTIYLILTSLLLVTGCYKEEYEQIDIEMKDLVGAKINPLEAQIAKINESLGAMHPLSEELKNYIAALEKSSEGIQEDIDQVNKAIMALKSSLSEKNDASKGEILAELENAKAYLELQLSNVDSTVQALKNKYDSLAKQAEDLETLVADKYAGKEWIDATFVTLDAQKEVIADVAAVQKLISTLNEASLKIESDLKSFIDEKIKETLKGCEAGIAELVADIAKDYTEAISKAVEDLKKAYTPEVSSAISELETSIMIWVSEALDDYYTVAAAKAQIEAFKVLIGNVPEGSNLQSQIDALAIELDGIEAEIGDVYMEVISSAITECEGKLKEALSEKILDIRNGELKNITEKVSSLENDVDKLWESLNALESRINTLDEQVLAIKNTLKILSDLNISLKEYILGVEEDIKGQNATEAATLKELLESLKTAVNGPDNDTSLQNLISKLKSYVGTIPADETDVVSWVKNSIATMDKAFETYATLDYVNGLKNEIDLIVKDHSSRLKNISDRLGTAIADSRTTVDSWISEKLGSYCKKADALGKLESFETTLKDLIANGDKALEDQITTLSAEVKSTISDLQSALNTAISTAITELNGFVSSSVTEALEDALLTLQDLDVQTTAIEMTINDINSGIQILNMKIARLQEEVLNLKQFVDVVGYKSLKEIVETIETEIEALRGKYASLERFNEINDLVTGQNGYAAEIEKLKKMVDDIKTAEDTIENFNELAKDFDLDKDNLKVIVDEITADLEKLKTTVFGDGTKPGLRKQLDDINTAIEKINERIEKLNNDILKKVKEFTSIVYDFQSSSNEDGKVRLEYDGTSSYTGKLYYDVRPKAIASTVASVATIQYISTPVRSSLNLTKAEAKITGNNDNGKITAEVTLPAGDVTEGLSVALFAGDFSSEFVGIYTTKKTDERIYCSPQSLYFQDGASGTQTVKLYYSSSILLPSINIDKPGWITVTSIGSIMTEGDMYVREYKIEVSANTDSASREGNVKFTIPRIIIIGRDISTTLTVKQGGREKQTIRDFSPESGSLKFTWDGKVIDEEGEITDIPADITVITSDKETDWKVTSSSDWASVTKSDNKAGLSVKNNTTGADREGTLVFTPVGGDPVEYKFTQLKRDKTDISVTIGGQPVEKIILNYNGTGYKTSDDATEWKEFNYGNSLLMTVTTEDKSTDWSVSEDPTSDWITAAKSSQYLSLSNIAANGSETDRSLAVVISNSAGEIGRIPVTQLCRKFTTVTTADPHYMFSYDAKKYRDYTVEPENWTSISNNRIDVPISTGDGSEDWTVVSSNPEWLSVENRNGSLRLTAGVSNSPEPREATVTFSCGDYQIEGQEMVWTVKQQAVPNQTFTFGKQGSSNNYYIGEDGLIHISRSTNGSMYVYVKGIPNDDWTVKVDGSSGWLSVSGPSRARQSGEFNYYITLTSSRNNGKERTATLKFTCGDKDYFYTVYQDSRSSYSFTDLRDKEYNFAEQRDTYSVSTSDNSRDWNVKVLDMDGVEKDQTYWLNASTTSTSNNVTLVLGKNDTGERRQAQLLFYTFEGEDAESARTITVTQNPAPTDVTLSFDPVDAVSFDSFRAGEKSITVTPDPSYYSDWTVEKLGENHDWLAVEKTSTGVKLTARSDNTSSTDDRTVRLKFTSPGHEYEFNVTQPKFVLSMTVNPTTIYFSGDGTRYKTAESSSWSRTYTQGGLHVPASVTMTDDSDNWNFNSSFWPAGAVKDGKTLKIKPREDLSSDSWSSEKPSGTVTVTSTADAGISEEISIVQNRPMTISSSSANNTATVTVKSDSDVTISWGRNLIVAVDGKTQSGNSVNLGIGEDIVFTVKRSSSSRYNNDITINNAEGSSKQYTVSGDGNLR